MVVARGSKIDESEYRRVSTILSVLGIFWHGGRLVETCVRTDSPMALVHNAFANHNQVNVIDGLTYDGSCSGEGVTGGVGSGSDFLQFGLLPRADQSMVAPAEVEPNHVNNPSAASLAVLVWLFLL